MAGGGDPLKTGSSLGWALIKDAGNLGRSTSIIAVSIATCQLTAIVISSKIQ